MTETNKLLYKLMKTYLFLILILPILISCNESKPSATVPIITNTKPVQKSTTKIFIPEDFKSKVFFIGPNLDSTKVEILAECDCCASNLVFLTKNRLLGIDYCESDTFYTTGNYKIIENQLVITYDSISATEEYNWENENDSTATMYFCKKEITKEKFRHQTFKLSQLKNKTLIYQKNYGYGLESRQEPVTAFIEKTPKEIKDILNLQ